MTRAGEGTCLVRVSLVQRSKMCALNREPPFDETDIKLRCPFEVDAA